MDDLSSLYQDLVRSRSLVVACTGYFIARSFVYPTWIYTVLGHPKDPEAERLNVGRYYFTRLVLGLAPLSTAAFVYNVTPRTAIRKTVSAFALLDAVKV
jgi:hypothetical protein